MKRLMTGVILLMMLLFLYPEGASAVVGYRGATWGEVRWDIPHIPGADEDYVYLQGWVKQGIDWARWGNTTLNTYAALRFKRDSIRHDWNNVLGPSVGVSLDIFQDVGVSATIGAEYAWDRYYHSDRWDQRISIYFGWYGWWDLKQGQ